MNITLPTTAVWADSPRPRVQETRANDKQTPIQLLTCTLSSCPLSSLNQPHIHGHPKTTGLDAFDNGMCSKPSQTRSTLSTGVVNVYVCVTTTCATIAATHARIVRLRSAILRDNQQSKNVIPDPRAQGKSRALLTAVLKITHRYRKERAVCRTVTVRGVRERLCCSYCISCRGIPSH